MQKKLDNKNYFIALFYIKISLIPLQKYIYFIKYYFIQYFIWKSKKKFGVISILIVLKLAYVQFFYKQ